MTLLAFTLPAYAKVTVITPSNAATVGTSVHFSATATAPDCKEGVASMGVYVDDKLIKVEDGNAFDGNITLTPGKRHTVVEEWDHCGGASYKTIDLVAALPSPTATLAANPAMIVSGKSVMLTATAANAAQVNITGSDGSSYALQPTGGVLSVRPAETTTYTATALGADGKASAVTTVTVTPAPLPAIVSMSATPASIPSGKSSALTVSAANATQVKITGSDGSSYALQPTGGTQSVSPAETTTYTVIAIGEGGDASAARVVTVTYGSHSIPSNAISSGYLDGSSHWEWNHDPGTKGTSTGTSQYPETSPSIDYKARQYSFSYSDHGGEIYHISFANDTTATHFVYDAYVYLTDPSQVENIEMDMNQVMADGRSVILGTQCSGYSGTWDFTTVYNGGSHWSVSNIPCNPTKWTANTWHHVQIATHRDSNGVATYDWVNVDGTYSDFQSASGASALSLGWPAGDLLVNFQLDGASAETGSATVYTDQLQIYRW
jgi:hypothetical protein